MLPGCPTSRPPPRQSSGCSQRLREVQNVEPAHGTNTRTRTEQGQQNCLQTGRPCPREDSTAQEPRQLRIRIRLKPAPCGRNFRASTYHAATRHHAWHILSFVSVLDSLDQISSVMPVLPQVCTSGLHDIKKEELRPYTGVAELLLLASDFLGHACASASLYQRAA